MGRNQVDRIRRGDEVLYRLEDRASPYILYIGRTDIFGAPTNQPIWQIKRIVTVGDTEEVFYADHGKYNCVWDLRASYFPPPPPPSPPTNWGLPQEVDIYPGVGTFLDYVGNPAPGSEITVISYVVAANKLHYLHSIVADSSAAAKITVYLEGDNIMRVRTAPGRPSVRGIWAPYRHATQGLQVDVTCEVRSMAVAPDVEIHLMVSETTG